jgi:hypothetical protein
MADHARTRGTAKAHVAMLAVVHAILGTLKYFGALLHDSPLTAASL